MTALHNPARIEHEGNQTYGAQTYGAEPRLGLRDLVKVLQRRRSIIIGTVAVTTLASAFLAYYLTPQYTAVAAISIEPRATCTQAWRPGASSCSAPVSMAVSTGWRVHGWTTPMSPEGWVR